MKQRTLTVAVAEDTKRHRDMMLSTMGQIGLRPDMLQICTSQPTDVRMHLGLPVIDHPEIDSVNISRFGQTTMSIGLP